MSDNLSSELHLLSNTVNQPAPASRFWFSRKRQEEAAFLNLLTNVPFVFGCKKLILLCVTLSPLDITLLNLKDHLSKTRQPVTVQSLLFYVTFAFSIVLQP